MPEDGAGTVPYTAAEPDLAHVPLDPVVAAQGFLTLDRIRT